MFLMNMRHHKHHEGPLAKTVVGIMDKTPTDIFFGVAWGSLITSLLLQLSGKKHESLFIGQWVPTLLILAVFGKAVQLLCPRWR